MATALETQILFRKFEEVLRSLSDYYRTLPLRRWRVAELDGFFRLVALGESCNGQKLCDVICDIARVEDDYIPFACKIRITRMGYENFEVNLAIDIVESGLVVREYGYREPIRTDEAAKAYISALEISNAPLSLN